MKYEYETKWVDFSHELIWTEWAYQWSDEKSKGRYQLWQWRPDITHHHGIRISNSNTPPLRNWIFI